MSDTYTLVDDNFNWIEDQTYNEARTAVASLAPGESVTVFRDKPTKEFHAYYMGHVGGLLSPRGFGQHKVVQAVDFQDAAEAAFSNSQHSTGARYLITGEGSDVLDFKEQQARVFEAVRRNWDDDYDLHVDLGVSEWLDEAYRHGYYTIRQITV